MLLIVYCFAQKPTRYTWIMMHNCKLSRSLVSTTLFRVFCVDTRTVLVLLPSISLCPHGLRGGGWARRSAGTSPSATRWWRASRSGMMRTPTVSVSQGSISRMTAGISVGFCCDSIDRWTTLFLHTVTSCRITRWRMRSSVSLWTSTGWSTWTFWRTLGSILRRALRATTVTRTPFSHGATWSTAAFLHHTGRLAGSSWAPGRRMRASPGSTAIWQTSRPTFFHRTAGVASSTCTPSSDWTAWSTQTLLDRAARSRPRHRATGETRQHKIYQ